MENLQTFKYELLTSKCKTDGAEGATVYGVSCDSSLEFEDISANRAEVEQLITLLNKGNVAPDQILYIIEDYIAEY